jgi:hypothetical protein
MKQQLVEKVLEQMVKDIEAGDLTAIEELIADIPDQVAIHYLPEGGAE